MSDPNGRNPLVRLLVVSWCIDWQKEQTAVQRTAAILSIVNSLNDGKG